MISSIIIILAVIVLDQASKLLLQPFLMAQPGQTLPLIRDVFHFTYVENEGAAFGMLADKRWIFMVLSVIGIGALLAWLLITKPQSKWMRYALAFVIGGGIGNMIDRVRLGYVIDFIDCRFIRFYEFNVADSFVCIGCGMFLLAVVIDEVRAFRQKKKDAAAPAPSDGTKHE